MIKHALGFLKTRCVWIFKRILYHIKQVFAGIIGLWQKALTRFEIKFGKKADAKGFSKHAKRLSPILTFCIAFIIISSIGATSIAAASSSRSFSLPFFRSNLWEQVLSIIIGPKPTVSPSAQPSADPTPSPKPFVAPSSQPSAGQPAQFLEDGTINNDFWGIVANDPARAVSNVSALNAALAWANKNGIKEVRLDSSTYYVDGQHTRVYSVSDKSIGIPSNISFDLNGSTLIQVPNDKEGYAIFTIVGSSNVRLFNGTLVGDKSEHIYVNSTKSTHEYGLGIDIRGGTNIGIADMDISDMTGDSILVGGKDTYLKNGGTISNNIAITGCILHDNRRQGISVIGASTVKISDCEIYGIGQENGTDPSCGIDLENELDWPVEFVTISNNNFYDNKKAAVLVHRGSLSTVIEENIIDGYVVLVYGENTTVAKNTISNGGIYSVDTSEPIYTFINGNTLHDSNIEILKNYATVISNNVIDNGIIKFNYASGAVYDNKISNDIKKTFGIQVYADKQASGYNFLVYLSNNQLTGAYATPLSVSKATNLTIIYDAIQTINYIDTFGKASLPQDIQPMKLNHSFLGILIGLAALVSLLLLYLLFRRVIRSRKPGK